MDLEKLKAQLTIDEKRMHKPYRDTVNKLTIGIGRNLNDVGLSDDEIDLLFKNDVARACASLDAKLPWWSKLDDARQDVLLNMCFNMGITRLLGFHNFLSALEEGQYVVASKEMLNSMWAGEVGDRATRLADVMRMALK